jgi:hypothetical protein
MIEIGGFRSKLCGGYAAWHPDEKRLVAVSERKGKFDLWMYEVA